MRGDIPLLLCISLGYGQGRIILPLFLNIRLGKSPKTVWFSNSENLVE